MRVLFFFMFVKRALRNRRARPSTAMTPWLVYSPPQPTSKRVQVRVTLNLRRMYPRALFLCMKRVSAAQSSRASEHDLDDSASVPPAAAYKQKLCGFVRILIEDPRHIYYRALFIFLARASAAQSSRESEDDYADMVSVAPQTGPG